MVAASRKVCFAALFCGAVAASEAGAAAGTGVPVLRDWQNDISKSLADMDEIQTDATACKDVGEGLGSARDWAIANCDAESAESCQARIIIRQNVQRFGTKQQVIADLDADEMADSLKDSLQAERLELQQKKRQLTQMIASAEGVPGSASFSDAEIADQVRRARSMAGSVLGRVDVFLGVPKETANSVVKGFLTCRLASLVKPAPMFRNSMPAEENARDDRGEPILLAADMSEVHSRSKSIHTGSLFLATDRFTTMNNAWARNHRLLTYVWLYVLNLWAFMVPLFGSGPFMPEASCNFASIGFLPWCRMFGGGVSCASPAGIIFETANPGASSWSEFSEFGLLTFSPRPMARSSCWMIPGIGQVAQFVPGRMLPDRTFCGSHPSGCFNLDGRPSTAATFLAPRAEGYDEDLVQLLYSLQAQNISFGKATFYTTSLTQLAALGFYPDDHALQHHGVQLTLKDNSTSMAAQPGNRIGDSSAGARVLTVEMMVDGLLWTLRETELAAEEVHSTQTYEFNSIRPEVVADFILDQKGTTYQDANCQLYATNLMDRVLFHGNDLQGSDPVIRVGVQYTYRLIAFMAVAILGIAVSLAFQWAITVRTLMHMKSKGQITKPLATLRDVVEGVSDDMIVVEQYVAKYLGARTADFGRRFAIGSIMLASPPIFWYVAYKMWKNRNAATDERQAVSYQVLE